MTTCPTDARRTHGRRIDASTHARSLSRTDTITTRAATHAHHTRWGRRGRVDGHRTADVALPGGTIECAPKSWVGVIGESRPGTIDATGLRVFCVRRHLGPTACVHYASALRVASRERVDSNARTMAAVYCIDWSEAGYSDLSGGASGACVRAMRAVA